MQTAAKVRVSRFGRQVFWKLFSFIPNPDSAARPAHSDPASLNPTMNETRPIVTELHIKTFQSEIIGSNRMEASERQKHHSDPKTRTGCSRSKLEPALTNKKHIEAAANKTVDGRNQCTSSNPINRH